MQQRPHDDRPFGARLARPPARGRSRRAPLWNKLAVEWRPDKVHDQVRTIDFEGLSMRFDAYLKGTVRSGTVVRIAPDSHP